jgi:hypothetical protein
VDQDKEISYGRRLITTPTVSKTRRCTWSGEFNHTRSAGKGWAASKDRVVIFKGRFGFTASLRLRGGGIVGIWLHMIEPLVQMDFGRNEYVGVLAESWEFQGRNGYFTSGKTSVSQRISLRRRTFFFK